MDEKTTYSIRGPWPDEHSRVDAFLREFNPRNPYAVRIAVTGPWERIIGVAAKEEGDSEVWVKLRPKYIDTDLKASLCSVLAV